MRSSGIALLLLGPLLALAGCTAAAPAHGPDEFTAWAAGQDHVASVESSADGRFTSHLVVDGAIDADGLLALTTAARAEASTLGFDASGVNVIVGNAWGFSLGADDVNVTTVNALRDDPLLVGATINYEPIDPPADYVGGLHATVGSQAGLRDAPASVLAAYTDAGGDLGALSVAVSTADGAFAIVGVGSAQPAAAIALWQAVSGRVLPLSAVASVDASGAETLELTVGSAAEKTAAEGVGAEHPGVVLRASY